MEELQIKETKNATLPLVENVLKRHFGKQPLQDLITAGRGFPPTGRVDLQLALDKMFSELANAKLIGVHSHFGQQMPLTIAHLLGSQHFPVVIGPLQHDEIDIGETLPARCLRQGLWLARQGTVPFALLLAHGTYIEIAVPPGEAAAQLSRRFLDEIEEFVRRTASYRGKVISLDRSDGYSGK